MILHVTSIWECYAQNLKPQGQFVCESEEGLAFAHRGFGGEVRDSGANAKPLRYLHYLPRGSAGGENENLVDANMLNKASKSIEGNQRNETMIHSLGLHSRP